MQPPGDLGEAAGEPARVLARASVVAELLVLCCEPLAGIDARAGVCV